MASLIASELAPGPDVRDDAALAAVIHQQVSSYAHPTSTAPMGGDADPWAVVDSTGLVRGVDKLRVVDASIMPRVPSAATNLPTIMIAEHIARRHLG